MTTSCQFLNFGLEIKSLLTTLLLGVCLYLGLIWSIGKIASIASRCWQGSHRLRVEKMLWKCTCSLPTNLYLPYPQTWSWCPLTTGPDSYQDRHRKKRPKWGPEEGNIMGSGWSKLCWGHPTYTDAFQCQVSSFPENKFVTFFWSYRFDSSRTLYSEGK